MKTTGYVKEQIDLFGLAGQAIRPRLLWPMSMVDMRKKIADLIEVRTCSIPMGNSMAKVSADGQDLILMLALTKRAQIIAMVDCQIKIVEKMVGVKISALTMSGVEADATSRIGEKMTSAKVVRTMETAEMQNGVREIVVRIVARATVKATGARTGVERRSAVTDPLEVTVLAGALIESFLALEAEEVLSTGGVTGVIREAVNGMVAAAESKTANLDREFTLAIYRAVSLKMISRLCSELLATFWASRLSQHALALGSHALQLFGTPLQVRLMQP